jgi:xanthine dehydrogenase accessory factor
MLEVFETIEDWLSTGKHFAIAKVIGTWGSSPRPVGSVLLVSEDMDMAGSVSGGCVENAVVKEAIKVLTTGVPKQLHYGISDDDAWEVGLMCGGTLDVLVEPFPESDLQKEIMTALRENTGGVLLSKLDVDTPKQQFIPADQINESQQLTINNFTISAWRERKSQIVETADGRWFLHVLPRKNKILIFGAAHIAVELVRLARMFDFEAIVIDPRKTFAERTQFTEAPDQMLIDWPAEVLPQFTLDHFTYAVLLTHDPKIDDQALDILLNSEIGYIGAIGSKRTNAKRETRLRAAGYDDAAIARIHAPIGLNIGSKGAKEIALSIMAEIVKVKNGKD